VSGYLLTDPPPGQPRLVGADASHAWLAVWCPRLGWVDLDPTNDVLPSRRHVTLAWGRDYGDVSPLRGVVLGGRDHTLHVGVRVMPAAEAGLGAALIGWADCPCVGLLHECIL
jgi:transglutaminase-like putative cysteine protease